MPYQDGIKGKDCSTRKNYVFLTESLQLPYIIFIINNLIYYTCN